MTKTIEHIEPSARYELREAADALSVDKSTIQRWSHDGLLRFGIKKSNNRKFWLGSELIRFWKAEY
jgi:predicted site-specific integrase-resolvase